MTETSTHQTRIKRLHYQSWHRGCKETDLLLGRFADAVLPMLSEEEVDLYEALLDEQDSDIWKWYTGALDLPEQHNNAIWQRLKQVNEDAVSK